MGTSRPHTPDTPAGWLVHQVVGQFHPEIEVFKALVGFRCDSEDSLLVFDGPVGGGAGLRAGAGIVATWAG